MTDWRVSEPQVPGPGGKIGLTGPTDDAILSAVVALLAVKRRVHRPHWGGRPVMAKIRHIAICGQDTNALSDFYKATFGMHEIRRQDGQNGLSIFLSDGYLNLAVLPADANGGREGIYHFGFQVEDVQETGRVGKEAGAKYQMSP